MVLFALVVIPLSLCSLRHLLPYSGFNVHFVADPLNLRFETNSPCHNISNVHLPPNIPPYATAIIATITIYSTSHDFGVVSFGRNGSHACDTWDNAVFESSGYFNDVLLTGEGRCNHTLGYCDTSAYGNSHGTVIIPVKMATSTIDIVMAMGMKVGTMYLTIQVYGYFTGNYFFDHSSDNGSQNIKLNVSQINFTTTITPPGVPAEATGILGTLSTFISNRNEFYQMSMGRFPNHSFYTWDNNDFLHTDEFYNDVLLAHEGNPGFDYYFGHSHGSVIVPLDGNGNYHVVTNLGKTDNASAYMTNSLFGYVPPSAFTNIKFLPMSQLSKIPIVFFNPNTHVYDIGLPANTPLPTTANAILATIYTYQNASIVSDHMVHSFGRYADHTTGTYDNSVRWKE